MTTPDHRTESEVLGWLEAFAAAVRDVDYDAGRAMFAPDVVGFGTVGVLLSGLETLMTLQWKRVWGVTSGFCFDLDTATVRTSGDVAWVAVPWASRTGKSDRGPFDRRGRATYILHRREGKWLAVHTHHSLDPSGAPPGTWGRRKTDHVRATSTTRA
jgi:ketosteroid isomerase-like protein